ncbi:hypothetical protein AVT43_gp69 [Polaribacter phage P12002L]|uniref:Uncharacterized protein n=1 Tax=Polaribacter phage P12002L TaxID=1647386 RepID=A0A0F7IJK2_9CAUD|nr:hypothetical protein AVT43_gp69 [Polaribacter phage P12002L]AKG94243.1 hypothetical protein P12002L_0069 [Polaribacter phage P12002L]
MALSKTEFRRIDILSLSILTNQLALFYNEELKRLKSRYYKHNLKKYLNLTIKELLIAEQKEFDLIEQSGEEISTKQSTNLQSSIEYLSKFGLIDFMFLNKMNLAGQYDRKRLEGIAEKIILDHQKKSKK